MAGTRLGTRFAVAFELLPLQLYEDMPTDHSAARRTAAATAMTSTASVVSTSRTGPRRSDPCASAPHSSSSVR